MADPTYLDDYVLKRYKTVARTINEQGNIEIVGEDDLADWLADNPDMRPPGTGEGGEWTLADEKAAVDLYDEGKDYGEEREIWDILADEAGITGPVDSFTVPLSEPPAEGFDFEAHADRHWALEEAKKQGAMDPQIREGLTGLLPTPEMFGRFSQEAAKRALAEGEGKPKRKRKGFPFSDETVLYGEEQDPGALQEETYRSNILSLVQGLKGVGERTDQKEYEEDQRTMATPGYGRSIDNPYGGD